MGSRLPLARGRRTGAAVGYLLTAAASARRGWAKEAAVDLYTKALELAESDELRREIRLRRGLALVELEDFERGDERDELLPELDGQSGSRRCSARGRATHWSERDDETIETGEQAFALAEELGDPRRYRPRSRCSPRDSRCAARREISTARSSSASGRSSWVPEAGAADLREALYLYHDLSTGPGLRAIGRAVAARRARSRATFEAPRWSCAAAGSRRWAWRGSAGSRRRSRSGTRCSRSPASSAGTPAVLLNYSALAFRELLRPRRGAPTQRGGARAPRPATSACRGRSRDSDLIFTELLAGDVGRRRPRGRRCGRTPSTRPPGRGGSSTGAWPSPARRSRSTRRLRRRRSSGPQRSMEITIRTRRRKYQARGRAILGEALRASAAGTRRWPSSGRRWRSPTSSSARPPAGTHGPRSDAPHMRSATTTGRPGLLPRRGG